MLGIQIILKKDLNYITLRKVQNLLEEESGKLYTKKVTILNLKQ